MTKRVLVVDDELSISNFIADIVLLLGYEAKILTSGKRVLSTAKEWKPDLITLDIMMPVPDGVEVLRQLKNDPETSSIPIFIVSVLAGSSGIKGALDQAQSVFQKPFETKAFIDQVRKVCK